MLGTITLADSRGGDGDRKLIIDGQQRIVTLALILAAARERLLGGDAACVRAADASAAANLSGEMSCSLCWGHSPPAGLFTHHHTLDLQEGDTFADLPPQPRILLKNKADTELLTKLLKEVEFVQQPETAVPLEGSSQPKLWANMQVRCTPCCRHVPLIAMYWVLCTTMYDNCASGADVLRCHDKLCRR
jgi:hypothetical protein